MNYKKKNHFYGVFMHILSFVGVSYIEGDSNEPYTYLLEYLLENILDYNDYKLINV